MNDATQSAYASRVIPRPGRSAVPPNEGKAGAKRDTPVSSIVGWLACKLGFQSPAMKEDDRRSVDAAHAEDSRSVSDHRSVPRQVVIRS